MSVDRIRDDAPVTESARAALSFIAAVRGDGALRESVAAVVAEGLGLSAVVEVARRSGFAVRVDDLRAAFAADWGMRRAFYLRD